MSNKGLHALFAQAGGPSGATPLIGKSIIFGGVSGNLARTPAVAGNPYAWTFAFWVKFLRTGGFELFMDTAHASTPLSAVYAYLGRMGYTNFTIGTAGNGETDNTFVDTAGWYHVCYVWDSNNPTPADRMRVFVNGTRIPVNAYVAAMAMATVYPSLGQSSRINSASLHRMGCYWNVEAGTFGHYQQADTYFTDGVCVDRLGGQLDGSGHWVANPYAGAMGANGFHLDFADVSMLGRDVSGNGNHWAVSGDISSSSDHPTYANAAIT